MSNPYQEHFKRAKKSRESSETKRTPLMRKARKSKFPTTPVVIMTLVSGMLGWGYANVDTLEEQFQKFELGVFGVAFAEEETAKPSGEGTAKAAAGATAEAKKECPETSVITSEETSHFSKLSERKKELDLREQELNALEEELHNQRQEVESRIAKLENIRGEIGTVLKERIEIDEERVTRLVEFYSNMKPKQAAEIFNDLNEGLAVEVLGRMKKKNAAEIMNLLEPKKAQALSEKFAGYKRR